MKIEDLKGHLIARRANLQMQGGAATAQILQMEKQLDDLRRGVATLQGACEEIDKTIALIDQKTPVS